MHRVLLLSLLAPTAATADTLSWSARLTDAAGTPLNSTHDLTLVLHDRAVPEAGSELDAQTFPGVTLNDGYVSVVLGEPAPLPEAVLDGRDLWVEVQLDGSPLTPLQRLHSVPSAAAAARLSTPDSDAAVTFTDGDLVVRGPSGATALTVDSGGVDVSGHATFATGSVQIGGRHMLSIQGNTCTNQNWSAVISNGADHTYMSFEMAFSHCGGGCHGAQRIWKGFFNAYTQTFASFDSNAPLNNGGSWTFGRNVTGNNGSGDISHRTTITKLLNSTHSFCGTVNVWVESNRPLALISQSG